MAKAFVIFEEVNVSFSTSLTCPTDARYRKRRPQKRVSAKVIGRLIGILAYPTVQVQLQSLDGVGLR